MHQICHDLITCYVVGGISMYIISSKDYIGRGGIYYHEDYRDGAAFVRI